MIHMGQMILSEPSIIIIWTYPDMMDWMSRILVGEMAVADEGFCSKLGKCGWFLFTAHKPLSNSAYDPHGPDDPFRTINYHHLDISGHDGMDEQDVGLRNVWCWCGKLLSSWRIVADFSSNCIPTWSYHDDQHEPDDPFRTINYHHQDISGHDGMDEQDIGWRNGWCWWGFWIGSLVSAADFPWQTNC